MSKTKLKTGDSVDGDDKDYSDEDTKLGDEECSDKQDFTGVEVVTDGGVSGVGVLAETQVSDEAGAVGAGEEAGKHIFPCRGKKK